MADRQDAALPGDAAGGDGGLAVRITAKWGGQCRLCYREIWNSGQAPNGVADVIEWSPKAGASHADPHCEDVEDRRIGTAAETKPLDLPHKPRPGDDDPVDWSQPPRGYRG